MRERLTVDERLVSANGITPACAGKTHVQRGLNEFARDHPRMCGKDMGVSFEDTNATGSPPHVRERPLARLPESMPARITPACAGKTLKSV